MKKSILFIFLLAFSGLQVLFAQTYCEDDPTALAGEYISNVSFGTQFSNPSGGDGYTNYTGDPNLVATVLPNSTYNISVDLVTGTYTHHVFLYFDWNDDGSFEEFVDLGEGSGNFTLSDNYTIPNGTPSGDYRMRVYTKYNTNPEADGCYTTSNGEIEDYGIYVCDGVDMVLNATTVNQNNTNPIVRSSTRNQIIGFNINTQNCDAPIILNSTEFGAASSDDITVDVTNAELFYTGKSNAFSAANKVGATATAGLNFTISGIQNDLAGLNEGDNWFWLTYDIPASATLDNVVDAELISFNYDDATGTGNTETVTGGNPAGTRQIVNAYCVPSPVNTTGAEIDTVAIAGFKSDSDGHNGGFTTSILSDGSRFDLCANASYVLEVDYSSTTIAFPANYPMYLYGYFDWNRDGDYNDENEQIFLADDESPTVTSGNTIGTARVRFTVPADAVPGLTGMRISLTNEFTEDACIGDQSGEAEEYGFTIHNLAELNVTGDNFLCVDGTVDLTAANSNGSYVYQSSTDAVTWADIASTTDAANYTSATIDTTTYFRLKGSNAACTASEIFSEVIDIPFIGISNIENEKPQICLGDSSEVLVTYEYPSQNFTFATATDVDADVVTQIDLAVAGVPYAYINQAILQSICLDFETANAAGTSIFLLAPDGETKIRLSSGNGTNGTASFCFAPNAATAIEGVATALSGNYLPEQSLELLDGLNPNGTWSLIINITGSAGVLNSFSMNFGVNAGVNWTPAATVVNATSDTTFAKPTTTTTYKAALLNSYCSPEDSVEVSVLSGNPITIALTLDNPIGTICAGENVEFTATLSESIPNPPLKWFVNDSEVLGETGETFMSNTLVNGDDVKVEFELTTVCGYYFSADSLDVMINDMLTPSLSLTSANNFPVCDGASVTFSADSADWGTGATVEWFVNNVSAQMGGMDFTSNSLVNNDTVAVEINSSYKCLTLNFLTEDSVFTSSAPIDPAITLNTNLPTNGDVLCADFEINFSADTTANNSGGYGDLKWYFDGILISNPGVSFSVDTFGVGMHTVRVDYDVVSGCTTSNLVSDEVSFEIGNQIIPEIYMTSTTSNICDGDSVYFTVTSLINEGSSPEINWYKNGVQIPGETGMTFADNKFNNQDEINVRLRSSLECATFEFAFAEPVLINEGEVTETGINIQSVQFENPFCEGGNVLVDIEYQTGQGINPIYEWYINNKRVQKNGLARLNVDTIKDGDKVYAKMIANVVCPTPKIPVSDTLTFSVLDKPTVDFTAEQIGDSVVFTPNSLAFSKYKWTFGNNASSIQSSPVIKYGRTRTYQACLSVTDANGCVNATCKNVDYITVGITNKTGYSTISVYPNPNTGTVWIKDIAASANEVAIQLTSVDGKTFVMNESLITKQGNDLKVNMTEFAEGIYTLMIKSNDEIYIAKIQKK